MAKRLGRSKSRNLAHPADELRQSLELDATASAYSRSNMSTPNSRDAVNTWLESPIEHSLLSRTANFSNSSLNLTRPKTAGEMVGKRDWQAMLSTGAPIEIATEHAIFRFPTPVRRPSTANSIIPSPNMGQESGIGLALGSPSDKSFFMSSLNKVTNQEAEDRFPRPIRANTTRETPTETRPKLSRWRSLGGLFARRASPGGSQRGNASPALQEGSGSNTPARLRGDSTGSSNQSESSPQAGLWRRATRRKTRPRTAGEQSVPQQPKFIGLDVDIPEAHMERYSVLFQDVHSLPKRSSSLLARRHVGDGTRNRPMVCKFNHHNAADVLTFNRISTLRQAQVVLYAVLLSQLLLLLHTACSLNHCHHSIDQLILFHTSLQRFGAIHRLFLRYTVHDLLSGIIPRRPCCRVHQYYL